MPPSKPLALRLTPAALGDLEAIWLYGAEVWGPDQADRYSQNLEDVMRRLALTPLIARERGGFDPPVRIHPSGSHLIIYRVEVDHLAVLRVLGGQQDWMSILHMLDQ